jgi:hypothetical protein
MTVEEIVDLYIDALEDLKCGPSLPPNRTDPCIGK